MASAAVQGSFAGSVRAWWRLLLLSISRQYWSVQTAIAFGLLWLLALIVGIRAFWGWDVYNFSEGIITGVYISFFLPILCMCFGTQSLGGDWEERSLVWLLTRPLSRPAIYLAKFLSALPWGLGLTVGGLFLLGFMAGDEGLRAATLFWPAIALGSITYLSLFVLMGAWFRRSTVLAVLYSFVWETIFGNLPGLMKRISVGFYSRCMIFDIAHENGLSSRGEEVGIAPDRRELFMPVEGETALWALGGITTGLLIVGLIVFSRREYNNIT